MKDYLTLADILGMHTILVETYGGSDGVREWGGVEAAAFRPQCGYYTDVIEQACAILESLLMNHPFIDGNKRTAWACCDVFLRINGITLNVDDIEMYEMILSWITSPPSERWQKMVTDIRKAASSAV